MGGQQSTKFCIFASTVCYSGSVRNWSFADSVELLCTSRNLAVDVNDRRNSAVAKLIDAAEKKNNFTINLQMADNFHCRGV